jgi:hypothetical protein
MCSSQLAIQLRVQDVRLFLKQETQRAVPTTRYDLIVIDSTDIDLSISLATTLHMYKRLLKPRGILIAEVDTGGAMKTEDFGDDYEIFTKLFKHVFFFISHGSAWVPGAIVFAFCSNTVHPLQAPVDWAAFRAKQMQLTFFNQAVHYAAFALPTMYLQKTGQTEADVVSRLGSLFFPLFFSFLNQHLYCTSRYLYIPPPHLLAGAGHVYQGNGERGGHLITGILASPQQPPT